tara:strand:+ start:285 stop:470 length:186 start_codon:yes stop_codon:yes gene_type:complete
MSSLFSDLKEGDKFQIPGKEIVYEKTKAVKISCCKSQNARELNDPNKKTFFQPGTIVEKNG